MSDIITTGVDVDTDLSCSEPPQIPLIGAAGSVMAILLARPIRNNLADLIVPGLIADNTIAQFTDIADIIATGVDVDTDLPMGSSGAWGALQTRSSVLLNGTIHWSSDQFTSELKTQLDTEIEYISGSGIPKYVMRGEDDPDAGVAGRGAEDFRFYDEPGDLRIQQLALPNQWNEINMQMAGGHGSTLDILIAMFL